MQIEDLASLLHYVIKFYITWPTVTLCDQFCHYLTKFCITWPSFVITWPSFYITWSSSTLHDQVLSLLDQVLHYMTKFYIVYIYNVLHYCVMCFVVECLLWYSRMKSAVGTKWSSTRATRSIRKFTTEFQTKWRTSSNFRLRSCRKWTELLDTTWVPMFFTFQGVCLAVGVVDCELRGWGSNLPTGVDPSVRACCWHFRSPSLWEHAHSNWVARPRLGYHVDLLGLTVQQGYFDTATPCKGTRIGSKAVRTVLSDWSWWLRHRSYY